MKGFAAPFPKAFTTRPAWSTYTARGSPGSRARKRGEILIAAPLRARDECNHGYIISDPIWPGHRPAAALWASRARRLGRDRGHRHGKRVRVNARLIPGKGRGLYSFLDRKAPKAKTVRYWVQVINLDGSRSWHGLARVLRS